LQQDEMAQNTFWPGYEVVEYDAPRAQWGRMFASTQVLLQGRDAEYVGKQNNVYCRWRSACSLVETRREVVGRAVYCCDCTPGASSMSHHQWAI